MIYNHIGCLFDVDGTITDRPDHVDPRIIDKSKRIQDSGGKVAYITGRPAWWLEENVLSVAGPDIPLFGEYVSVFMHKGQTHVDPRAMDFNRTYRSLLKDRIAAVSRSYGVPIIMEDRRTYPEGGEMWFEEHLSILATWINPMNPAVNKDSVNRIVNEGFAASGLPPEEFNIYFAFNCSPICFSDNNKGNAAKKAVQLLDPEGKLSWYAFGDSKMDEEMVRADPERVRFVSVAGKASRGVLDCLEKLGVY